MFWDALRWLEIVASDLWLIDVRSNPIFTKEYQVLMDLHLILLKFDLIGKDPFLLVDSYV